MCGRGWCEKSYHLEGVSLSLAEELFVHERGGQSSPQIQATGRQHYGGLQTPRHADRRQNLALFPAFNITKCRFVMAAVFHMHMILLLLVLLLCISTLLCRSEKWGENGGGYFAYRASSQQYRVYKLQQYWYTSLFQVEFIHIECRKSTPFLEMPPDLLHTCSVSS